MKVLEFGLRTSGLQVFGWRKKHAPESVPGPRVDAPSLAGIGNGRLRSPRATVSPDAVSNADAPRTRLVVALPSWRRGGKGNVADAGLASGYRLL